MHRIGLAAVLLSTIGIANAAPAVEKPPGHTVAEYAIPRTGGEAARVWVYTPPGYNARRGVDYNLIVAFDGAEYLDEIPLPSILDQLIASGRMAPAVAVLIDNGSGGARIAELGNSAKYAAFVAKDVVDWTRLHFSVTHQPSHCIITGSSAGGLAAAYVALRYPDRFGAVVSQSGAFWRGNEGSNAPPYEWLTREYETSPRRNILIILEVGSLETHGAMGGAAPSILEANRHLHEVLRKKGYPVEYMEVPGGQHSPETWRVRLPDALAHAASR